MSLLWHRRDLRVADNRALAEAARDAPPVPVFVFDPDVLDHASPPRVAFMLDALRSLRSDYRDLGGDLLVARGDPAEILPRLAAEHDAQRVIHAADYSGLARERDERVGDALDDAGTERVAIEDALLHEPGSITTNEGTHYSVFSYFWRKWRDREADDPVGPPETVAPVEGDPLPTPRELDFDEPAADVPAAGTAAARERLDAFRSGPLFRYAEDRDYPAREGTSRLSADLRWGTIGVREVYAATEDAVADADVEAEHDSIEEFRSQLAWREFYAHVLRFNPGIVTEDVRAYENPIEWREDPGALRAWKDGETGYPVVDAGMRQLRAEAWMHNRVRMIVASFLTKDLLIDWRRGYEHFRERLVDHDPGNDAGGWQWAASTGTDAQPYFRIFNPMTQGERYDPDAEYIAEYVPELRGVEADAVHSWHEFDSGKRERLAPGYPAPIVDHAEARDRAIERFERARGEGD